MIQCRIFMNYETSQPWYCFPIAKINWLTTLLVTPIGPLGGAPAFCRLHPLSWFIRRSDYSEFYFFNIFIHIRRRRTAVAPKPPPLSFTYLAPSWRSMGQSGQNQTDTVNTTNAELFLMKILNFSYSQFCLWCRYAEMLACSPSVPLSCWRSFLSN